MPGSWLFQYSFWNGGSVAPSWVTSYWRGVSFWRSSSEEGLEYLAAAAAGATGGGSAAVFADAVEEEEERQPARPTRQAPMRKTRRFMLSKRSTRRLLI